MLNVYAARFNVMENLKKILNFGRNETSPETGQPFCPRWAAGRQPRPQLRHGEPDLGLWRKRALEKKKIHAQLISITKRPSHRVSLTRRWMQGRQPPAMLLGVHRIAPRGPPANRPFCMLRVSTSPTHDGPSILNCWRSVRGPFQFSLSYSEFWKHGIHPSWPKMRLWHCSDAWNHTCTEQAQAQKWWWWCLVNGCTHKLPQKLHAQTALPCMSSLDTKTATGVGNWVLTTDLESRFSNVWKVKANARADKATAPHMRLCKRSAAEWWLGKQCFVYLHQGWAETSTYPLEHHHDIQRVSAVGYGGTKYEGKVQVILCKRRWNTAWRLVMILTTL
jgi:hypothetical protein